MQRGLIDHCASQERIAILFQRDGQSLKPARPVGTQIALDPDLIDHWLAWRHFLGCAHCRRETTAEAVRAGGAGRLRMAHSAMARLITQPAPFNSAWLSSLGGPAINSPASRVSTCVPAPSPIA